MLSHSHTETANQSHSPKEMPLASGKCTEEENRTGVGGWVKRKLGLGMENKRHCVHCCLAAADRQTAEYGKLNRP